MKYISANKISDFVFHDAVFELLSFKNNDLTVSAELLNIHKTAEQNPFDADMEIKKATITFKNFRIVSYKEGDCKTKNENGEWITKETFDTLYDKEALDAFINEFEDSLTVYYFGKESENEYMIDAMGVAPYFTVIFGCSDIIIEWDEYRKKAWYELHRQYKFPVTLASDEGDIKTDLHIICHDEDVYCQGQLEKAPVITAGLKYKDKEIWGNGKDTLWVDAIADLQKKLPHKVTLKCCLTCRFGNMCPFGNKAGEVFCTKGKSVFSKQDVWDLFDNFADMEKLSRSYTDICENYEVQTKEHYTYNDFLYQLEK